MESNVANNRLRNGYAQKALGFNAFWAGMGAWYLPDGSDPIPLAYLDGSPFSSYNVPGTILFLAVGGSSLLTAGARWRRWPYDFLLTLAAGCMLFGWLFFEFLRIPECWAAKLFFTAVAAVIVAGDYQGWRQQSS